MLQLHVKFLDTCLTESLLLNHPFMKTFNRTMQCCLTFAKAMQRFTTTLTRNEPGFALLQDQGIAFSSELHRRKFVLQQTKSQVQ